jgi:glutathione S-transferase
MKLYYSPGACSLSPHIALREAGLEADYEKVDLKAKRTESGADYTKANPKGSVPALELDNDEILTEGPAVVQFIADQVPEKALAPKPGTPERYRLQEWLNFITSDLHKGFSPLFMPTTPEDYKPVVRDLLAKKYAFIDNALAGNDYLLGQQFTVADGYLFTVCRWAKAKEFTFGPNLEAHFQRVLNRPAVQEALKMEGLPTQ